MADTEKITVNLSPLDLGKIDLLAEQGHYSNRTDFIRAAIRAQLESHLWDFQQALRLRPFVMGIASYGKKELEYHRARHRKLQLDIVGALYIGRDVTPELALEVIESVRVRGMFNASPEVKAALADRTE
jgi:Arc/MetJ-type ribon-helix-helix transcriptional regulator